MKTQRFLPLFLFLVFATGLFSGGPSLFAADDSASQSPMKLTLQINGHDVLPSNGTVAGVWFFADNAKENPAKSQVLLLGHPNAGTAQLPNYRIYADLAANETVSIRIPATLSLGAANVSCELSLTNDTGADFSLTTLSNKTETQNFQPVAPEGVKTLSADVPSSDLELTLTTRDKPTLFHLTNFRRTMRDGSVLPLSLDPVRRPTGEALVACSPDFTPALEAALIEWDWRMQDGIETPLEPRSYMQAVEKRLPQGLAMLDDLIENVCDADSEAVFEDYRNQWKLLAAQFEELKKTEDQTTPEFNARAEKLWKDLHSLRRTIVLANPLFTQSPILFAKHVPGIMSHQLTQVYGYLARPGGGLFVLEEPGKSMKTRSLTSDMPTGNYMHPTVSYDGSKILFSFCEKDQIPTTWHNPNLFPDPCYQLYEMNADGSGIKKLTNDAHEYFAPIFLPDGDIVCTSTHRGGFHRCGGGPCFEYALTKMNADGSNIRPISWHETQEWNPTVLNDGRILYTRWDYVDRDAVFYQNLWSTRQDGTDVRIFYGNNTFVPCGIWESKAIPGSSKVMAIGGPHHGMSAGSIMLLDTSLGVDGPEPVTRLTPEVLYPESETPLPYADPVPAYFEFDTPAKTFWDAVNRPDRPAKRLTPTEEENRWPVHCFKSPWPLSEKYFIASYSFDKLLGEAGANIPNQFGLYIGDAFGNRELLYRDPNISSLWAIPLAARPEQPRYISALPEPTDENGNLRPGQFFVQNVYESWPWKMPEKIKELRLVQVLPKTTPHANNPMVGAANASPGKQILGTVPVAEDGSAWFEVPANTPFLLQAIGEDGKMVQGMRSLIYAQPGETSSCTGCHENRLATISSVQMTDASKQDAPSPIKPGPDGSKPLSYPIMIQPVLDRLCVECHNDQRADGNINLTGAPEGMFSKSYNALVPLTAYTAWGLPDGNHEPMSEPYLYGSHASKLVELLEKGHYDCQLTPEDWERLYNWIDGANALFYGTFNVENQKRQLNGERIEGPDLE